MRFSLSWLRDYVEFDISPHELAERLTMAGLEVEGLTHRGDEIDSIVVARIEELKPHPNAQRLVLCDVSDGTDTLSIVCGATNMKQGDKVALARVGAVLPKTDKFPDGIKIKKSKIRGEVSMGMLCAENELGLSEESEGIMILPEDAPIGEKVVDVLGLRDVEIEIAVTPNRPDCLSVVGVAREVAAILGGELRYPETSVDEGEGGVGGVESLASVRILDPEGCPRYSCRVIKGVAIGPSPAWLVARLEAAGIRSINNVVDVTNYVLLELGQPLHAFDYDLLEGGGQKGVEIVVRAASDGEKITTLDGVERTLTEEDLLICSGSRPVALAGVMGGADTEVSEGTANVLLESAYFNPVRVRRTSRRTNLRSESSYRFERGVDPEGVIRALDRAAGLISELAGGEVAKGRVDVYPEPIKRKEVVLNVERTGALIGAEISREEIKRHLASLGMDAVERSNGDLAVVPPYWRVDIEREIDLVEEIARLYGYVNVPTTLPRVQMVASGESGLRALESRAKGIMISAGFLECVNYSFEDPDSLALWSGVEPVAILNPLTAESSAMRTNLIAGLMKNLKMNLDRQEEDLRIFETGKCFHPSGDKGEDNGVDVNGVNGALPREFTRLAAMAAARRGVELWESETLDFFDMKGVLEDVFDALRLSSKISYREPEGGEVPFLHPGKSAVILMGSEEIGWLGELHPAIQQRLDIARDVYLFEIALDGLAELAASAPREFAPLPRHPFLRRDLSLVVDEGMVVGDILKEIGRVRGPYVESARVFDVFRGNAIDMGKKSVTVSLILRARDKTLTDEEANAVQDKIVKRLRNVLGTELRKT